jgi:DNA-binding CsgD family transcriptional regulator
VLDGASAEDRAALHGHAAELLYGAGASVGEVARHLIAARAVSEPWMMPVLQEAAGQALACGDTDSALHVMRFARRICSDDTQQAVVTSMLAMAKWRVDPGAAIRHASELGQAVLQGRLQGPQAVRAVLYLLWCGRIGEAMEVLESLTEGALDGPADADVLTARMWVSALYPDALPRRARVVDGAIACTVTDPQPQATSSLSSLFTGGAGEAAANGMAERALRTSVLDDSSLTLPIAELSALARTDCTDRTAVRCDSLIEETAARHSPTWNALLAGVRAGISIQQGNLVAAERHARSAMTYISPDGWGVAIGAPLASLLLATTAAGKYDQAAIHLAVPVPESMFRTPFGLHYLYARGRYCLATRRFAAALGDFQAAAESATRWALDDEACNPWRLGMAEAYLSLEAPERARELLREQLDRPGRSTRTRGSALRLLAAASEPEARPALLAEAVAVLQECRDRLELAHAFADLSRLHQANGASGQARTMLRRAHQLATQCGADGFSQALIPRADAANSAVIADCGEHGTELSEAEQRVGGLAAQGCTNRQIADRLFVTVSTVEQHLTRVYRKVKVTCRSDLPLWQWPDIGGSA